MPPFDRFILKHTKKIITLLLLIMFCLTIFSMKDDSLTRDEISHIPAGYSYLQYGEIRTNVEHPPLVKDIAAFPLLFLDSSFPSDSTAWKSESNPQWEVGYNFLYNEGNDTESIIFFSKLPLLLITALGGLLIYHIGYNIGKSKNKFTGRLVGLLSLVFYSFSPNLIANSKLVTTDAIVSIFIMGSLYTFARYFIDPNKKNFILATTFLTLALITKFSAAILIFVFVIALAIRTLTKRQNGLLRSAIWKNSKALMLILLVTILAIYGFYFLHSFNMSEERVSELIDYSILPEYEDEPIKNTLHFLLDIPGMKPLVLYLIGFLMVFGRVYAGHTIYFLGNFSSSGWWYFFPVIFLLKVPLSFIILLLTSLTLSIKTFLFSKKKAEEEKLSWLSKVKKTIFNYASSRFIEFSFIIFIIVYWIISISSSLNLGFRHILPTLPMTWILVSKYSISYLSEKRDKSKLKRQTISIAVFCTLIFWYIGANLYTFPHYLSYFNELIGRPSDGYKIAVDSSFDWGQDLKRLSYWVEENDNRIDKIKVHYFGGGDPYFYLGDKFEEWSYSTERPTGWFAISASAYQHSKKRDSSLSYEYLENVEPVTVIGRTIFVYYLEEE